MLRLENVRKYYNRNLVIDSTSLELNKGIFWIKGPNGSGKTTLLKMIAGMLPFEGDIVFNNISLKKQPFTYRQLVGWAEAEPLYPSFITGNDLLSLYGGIRKMTVDVRNELLEKLHLSGYINDPVGTYSAGMLKKLSLALAFCGYPPLIILDEPLITLDPDAFLIVNRLILEHHETHKTTFLISSHQDAALLSAQVGKELFVGNRTITHLNVQ